MVLINLMDTFISRYRLKCLSLKYILRMNISGPRVTNGSRRPSIRC